MGHWKLKWPSQVKKWAFDPQNTVLFQTTLIAITFFHLVKLKLDL